MQYSALSSRGRDVAVVGFDGLRVNIFASAKTSAEYSNRLIFPCARLLMLSVLAILALSGCGQLFPESRPVFSSTPPPVSLGPGTEPAAGTTPPPDVAPVPQPRVATSAHASTIRYARIDRYLAFHYTSGARLQQEISRAAESAITPNRSNDKGLIVFSAPDKMRVGISQTVSVRISRDQALEIVKQGMPTDSPIKSDKITIGDVMRVELRGEGFKVTPQQDNPDQNTQHQNPEWLFDVLPVSSGQHKLLLRAAIRYTVPDGSGYTYETVYARSIDVKVNWWWSIQTFVGNNLIWVLGGIGTTLTGILAYFLKRWLEG
jgi:hypothetical protein